jgi:Calcineurin-like phosphoesterase
MHVPTPTLRPTRPTRHIGFRLALITVLGLAWPTLAVTPALAADTTPPTLTAPVAVPQQGGTVGTTNPFRVTWSGSDTGTGIAGYRLAVSVDGGTYASVTLASATSRSAIVGLRAPHEARLRVRAVDRAGNWSAWTYGTTFRVTRSSEAGAGVVAMGPWTVATSTAYLGGRALRSGTAGATVRFTFTGSQVAWIGSVGPGDGRADIYLDGTWARTVDTHRVATAHRRILYTARWPQGGTHTITIRVAGTAGHPTVVVDGFVVVDPPAADPVLVGAGDVASCGLTADSKTAALLDGIAGRVFVAGDVAYPSGTAAQFRDCYGPTWGRWRLRTSPVPGNHDYATAGAAPYFAYFGTRAGVKGQGWYAENLGTWRVYYLNANCTKVGCGSTSAQVAWLRADLAANPHACVAAVWHQPLFSSGQHGNNASVRPLWNVLQAAGAELVINGHDHDYERFAPQTSAGVASATGIREFVVGTGGAALRPFATVRANSVVRNASTYGVLKLTLRAGGYDWRFVPVAGQAFADAGSATCH